LVGPLEIVYTQTLPTKKLPDVPQERVPLQVDNFYLSADLGNFIRKDSGKDSLTAVPFEVAKKVVVLFESVSE
jgi:hypothetical protein